MNEMYSLDKKITALVFFIPEYNRPMCHKVFYQVEMDPENLSPSGELIRFNYENKDGQTVNEIHGWKLVEEIGIQEILVEGEVSESAPVQIQTYKAIAS